MGSTSAQRLQSEEEAGLRFRIATGEPLRDRADGGANARVRRPGGRLFREPAVVPEEHEDGHEDNRGNHQPGRRASARDSHSAHDRRIVFLVLLPQPGRQRESARNDGRRVDDDVAGKGFVYAQVPQCRQGGYRGATTPATEFVTGCRADRRRQQRPVTEQTTNTLCATLETRPNPRSPSAKRNTPRSARTAKKPKRPAMTTLIACAAMSRRIPPAVIPRRFNVRNAG